jgi:hypothetical protein
MPKTMTPHPLLPAFVAAGATDEQIARHYGVATRTVERWRVAAGLKPNWERRRSGHGTAAQYARGCRCRDCTSANSAQCRQAFARMKATGLAPDDSRHGTVGAYCNWGCRCEPCTRVHAAACKVRNDRRRDAKRALRHA